MTIPRDQFELYESVILTEQITPAAAQELLRDNADFAEWYRARRAIATKAPRPSQLRPCPFCGSPAESDSLRHYRNISTGQLGYAAAIYCTACNADMTWCYRDTPEIPRNEVMSLLTEQWNARTAHATDEIDRLRQALRTAIGHIEHMGLWIAEQQSGYSFESLGEDLPGIRAAADKGGSQ